MCFRCPSVLSIGILLSFGLFCSGAERRVLRVCADPNNLPFSNKQGQGFENRIAGIVARDWGAKLEYTWWLERKSFIKNSLDEGRCDVLMGVPTQMDALETTRPYYRSTYVFVSRQDRDLQISSLGDPRLEKWRIGVQIVGDDYAPPANALARRGLAGNLVGYSLFGKYGDDNPPARIMDAVARGDIDVAIVWGPLAGYFAKRETVPLEIVPVSPAMFRAVPFTYDISLGVRKGDVELKGELNRVLDRECGAIQALLIEYGVPQAPAPEGKKACESSQQSSSASSR